MSSHGAIGMVSSSSLGTIGILPRICDMFMNLTKAKMCEECKLKCSGVSEGSICCFVSESIPVMKIAELGSIAIESSQMLDIPSINIDESKIIGFDEIALTQSLKSVMIDDIAIYSSKPPHKPPRNGRKDRFWK